MGEGAKVGYPCRSDPLVVRKDCWPRVYKLTGAEGASFVHSRAFEDGEDYEYDYEYE